MQQTRYTIAIPAQFNDGAEVPPALLDSIVRVAVEVFGGATLTQPARGLWRSDYTGQTYDEPMRALVLVGCGVDDKRQTEQQAEIVRALAAMVRDRFNQECVMVTQDTCNVEFV